MPKKYRLYNEYINKKKLLEMCYKIENEFLVMNWSLPDNDEALNARLTDHEYLEELGRFVSELSDMYNNSLIV